MSKTPSLDRFMVDYFPRLTEEGKAKIIRLFDEYGIRDRLLTKQETDEAIAAAVAIVRAHIRFQTNDKT